jgi:hypothetical protein
MQPSNFKPRLNKLQNVQGLIVAQLCASDTAISDPTTVSKRGHTERAAHDAC